MARSRSAFRALIALLDEIDSHYLGPENTTRSALDLADGHRYILHGLERALLTQLEADPEHPVFHRAVTPTMKFGGDSPDAIYHECNIRSDCSYVVRGNMAGAVYVSLSIQAVAATGESVGASINSDQLDVAADGSFEVLIGRVAQRRARNWLEMPEGAFSILARHYFEQERIVAADPQWLTPLHIATVGGRAAPPEPSEVAIAAGIERVVRLLRSRTLDESAGRPRALPSWVSTEPNCFNEPQLPGTMAYAAVDAAYAMAPYVIPPGKALMMRGRFPACRYAGVVLWNRFRQSYDYRHRCISLNRAQTRTDVAGNYRIVIAHEDPGVANWLDTGGRASGSIYWRFLLPTTPVPTPQTELIDLRELPNDA